MVLTLPGTPCVVFTLHITWVPEVVYTNTSQSSTQPYNYNHRDYDCDDDTQPQTNCHEGALRLIAQCDLSVVLGVITAHLSTLQVIPSVRLIVRNYR